MKQLDLMQGNNFLTTTSLALRRPDEATYASRNHNIAISQSLNAEDYHSPVLALYLLECVLFSNISGQEAKKRERLVTWRILMHQASYQRNSILRLSTFVRAPVRACVRVSPGRTFKWKWTPPRRWTNHMIAFIIAGASEVTFTSMTGNVMSYQSAARIRGHTPHAPWITVMYSAVGHVWRGPHIKRAPGRVGGEKNSITSSGIAVVFHPLRRCPFVLIFGGAHQWNRC